MSFAHEKGSVVQEDAGQGLTRQGGQQDCPNQKDAARPTLHPARKFHPASPSASHHAKLKLKAMQCT